MQHAFACAHDLQAFAQASLQRDNALKLQKMWVCCECLPTSRTASYMPVAALFAAALKFARPRT